MTSRASVTPSSTVDTTLTSSAPDDRADALYRTSHLKLVPPLREERDRISGRCYEVAARLDKSHPLSKAAMERLARATLQELRMPAGYVGWTMVILASAFWRDQVAATPPSRRLLLLPHCLKHTTACVAGFDEFGLKCRRCGACMVGSFSTMAEEMGYRVLVAEGSPIVMRIILSGEVDAIVGVACLNVLEKTIDKILLSGIPCMAVPLLSSRCKASTVDEDRVCDLLLLEQSEPTSATATYMHIMRAASGMFQPDRLERLAPRARKSPRVDRLDRHTIKDIEPIAATEAIAYDFLAKGGKYSRPFITLAVHDALTGGHATTACGVDHIAALPDAIYRTAMSIETFHKASLVHDDIEDDDAFRYGRETIHRQYGTPTAINVGDYLIGMGYRLVSREAKSLGPETVSDILDCLADAHLKLSEGQGAELLWRDAQDKRLRPIDALKIYALKTAPAFEAAMLVGVRLAGCTAPYRVAVKQFARNLGVAFQILNDLHDWRGDQDNKLTRGEDMLSGRPTVLWALALESLDPREQMQLQQLVNAVGEPVERRLSQVRKLYRKSAVFGTACRLIEKHRVRAADTADQVQHAQLKRLFHYLIDTVLDQPGEDWQF